MWLACCSFSESIFSALSSPLSGSGIWHPEYATTGTGSGTVSWYCCTAPVPGTLRLTVLYDGRCTSTRFRGFWTYRSCQRRFYEFLLFQLNKESATSPSVLCSVFNFQVLVHLYQYSEYNCIQIRLNVIQMTSAYDTPFGDVVENLLPFGSV